MNETIDKLLDAAENGMRLRGYHAVSFRDLADELGIKSASVHYYFRKKEDLGIAVVERYSGRFFDALAERAATATNSQELVTAFCGNYQAALKSSDKMCLCGLLGAEICGLPETVGDAVRAFLNANIDWVANALPDALPARQRQAKAAKIVSTLQGAMMLSTGLNNHKILDDAIDEIISDLREHAVE